MTGGQPVGGGGGAGGGGGGGEGLAYLTVPQITQANWRLRASNALLLVNR